MTTIVYLDTWLLRGLVSDRGYDRSEAISEIEKLKSHTFETVIPQIALGEAFAVIMKDFPNPTDAHTRLCKLYDDLSSVVDIERCLPSPTVKSLQYAQELKNSDSDLRETDLLIVAQALVDPNSQRLLTQDVALLNSQVIKNKEKELRENGHRNELLKIVDGL